MIWGADYQRQEHASAWEARRGKSPRPSPASLHIPDHYETRSGPAIAGEQYDAGLMPVFSSRNGTAGEPIVSTEWHHPNRRGWKTSPKSPEANLRRSLVDGRCLVLHSGAGSGNRTRVFSLEGCCSTIELYPRLQIRLPGRQWWRGLDSNQRRQSQRIYSPSPLTTRAPLQTAARSLATRHSCNPAAG